MILGVATGTAVCLAALPIPREREIMDVSIAPSP
jgi:hypothetical protein